jgi:HPt (histidine-containing phosphotransfer) domain-containing protein
VGEIDELANAIDRLWTKFLPQMEERVAMLQKAAESLRNGSLSEEDQRQANGEAHKLAGILGTFGLQQGTELAREAEEIYAGTLDRSPAVSERLMQIAEQLHAMIASRK